jgi:hypothetical protein
MQLKMNMMTTGMTAVTIAAGFGLAGAANAQECTIHTVLLDSQSDVSTIHHAAMNAQGEVVIGVNDLSMAPQGIEITRLLRWSLAEPGDTAIELLQGGQSSDAFAYLLEPTINDNDDIIFVGNGPDGLNVYQFDGKSQPEDYTGLLSFGDTPPIVIGDLTLLNDDPFLTFTYWQVSSGNNLEHCVERYTDNPDLSALELECTEGGPVIANPDANDAGDVAYRVITDNEQRIVLHGDPSIDIITVGEDGVLSGPSINAAGHIAFYANAPDDGFDEGIYLYTGTLPAVLVVDFAAHSLAPSSPLLPPRRPLLNDAGRIVFAAAADNAKEGNGNGGPSHGIYVYNVTNDALILIDDSGVAAPDQPRKVLDYLAEDSETDRILFRAVTTDGVTTGLFLAAACDVAEDDDTCPEDLNGDGVVNVSDLLILFDAWGDCPGCPEDFNDDGVVNVSDLLILFDAWGDCPE